MLLLFNKPFQVLSQFSAEGNKRSLRDYIDIADVYPAGRLDYDSEGLLLLTDDGDLQHRIAHPHFGKEKEYWVQIEGLPSESELDRLRKGVELKDGLTRPAQVELLPEPELWPRDPPIRFRQAIPTCWLRLIITEGRNRQVRRMTAHIGFPTLRLVRWRVGEWTLAGIDSGCYRSFEAPALQGANWKPASANRHARQKRAGRLRRP